MAKEQIIIGSRLPHGLILSHPQRPDERVMIAGLSSLSIKNPITRTRTAPSSFYATTEIDLDFWEAWKIANGRGFKALESGALFEGRNQTLIIGKAREGKKEKTGFEPANPRDFKLEKV